MFDYGVNEKLINSAGSIHKWPESGDRVALVDADSIAYIVGFTSDIQEYLKAKRIDYKNSSIWQNKIGQANWILDNWIENAGCDSAILFLTNSADNFRIDIAKTLPYKGQRSTDKPPFFYEIRKWMLEFHKARLSDHCEADDEISIEAWKRHIKLKKELDLWTPEHKAFSDFVIISQDKDLSIIPGWHCAPDKELEWVMPLGELRPVWREKEIIAYSLYPLFKKQPVPVSKCYTIKNNMKIKSEELKIYKEDWAAQFIWYLKGVRQDCYSRGKNKGKGKFKRLENGTKMVDVIHRLKGTGLKFFYSQLLTGDSADHYKGLPGVGTVGAYRALDNLKSEQRLFDKIKSMYKQEYNSSWREHLLEMGQLAWMQTYKGELWKIPESENGYFKSSFPV